MRMKPLILLTVLSTMAPVLALANCEVTPDGKKMFREIELDGCGEQFCVRYTKQNGRSGSERLFPRGCSASSCYSASENFTHVFPGDSSDGTQYLGSKSGEKIYLICRY